MDATSTIAIFCGAGLGALARWGLGLVLNPIFPTLPLGTLAANVLGGLLIGIALGLFSHFETLAPALKLAITTGFLGGLTTFSTFSAETANLLIRAEYLWAALLVMAHVALSLLAIFAGFAAVALCIPAAGNAP